jgi:DNA-binding response OmpR family regulator
LKRCLEEVGFEAEAAGDGKTAHSLTAEQEFDILIVDFGLADMDGIGLIHKLR